MTENKICGIFTVKGIKSENKIKLKHLENMNLKMSEYIPDTLIKRYEVMRTVVGEIYSCNFTDSFLSSSKKLPVSYVSVIYERGIRRILLLRIFLFFTIESEVKNVHQLLGDKLDGKFTMELFLHDSKSELDNKIDKYPGDDQLTDNLMNFTLDLEMKELMKGLMAEIDEKLRAEYEKEFEYYTPPTKVISLRNYKIE